MPNGADDPQDSPPALALTSHCAVEAFLRTLDAGDQEWLLAVYLTAQGAILGQYEAFRRPVCACVAPEHWQAVLHEALAVGVHHLVTIRHHNHRWPGPMHTDHTVFQSFLQAAEAQRTPCREHYQWDSRRMLQPLS